METNKLIIILVLIFLCLFIAYQITLNLSDKSIEEFTNKELIKSDKIYDKFYSNIYDQLFHNPPRVQFEVNDLNKLIEKYKLKPNILDLCCGTGTHARLFAKDKTKKITCVDNSNEMLKVAKKHNPTSNVRLVLGDAINRELFDKNSFSVITCYYFSVYYFKDLKKLINNVHYWLQPAGIFAVHLVNRDLFDPILDHASPYVGFSLQKYSKERVTNSKIHFNNFLYDGNFEKNSNKKKGMNNYSFVETFKHKKKKLVREQEHKLYMPKIDEFIQLMKESGFKKIYQSDMLPIGCEYNFIFYFQKK